MPIRLIAVALPLTLFLAACQEELPPAEEEPEQVVEPEAGGEELAPAEPARQVSLDESVDMARQDLAGRLGVEPHAISVIRARRVTWRDGALGCPEPGGMYTQALVEGMYVKLEFDGERHAYHAGRDGVPFACPSERSQSPAESESDR
ncbi:hypothetical protein IC757_14785 [Wenzhouxiangella sp. AB-CW3]|uniref:hypothetical protein n=1 Tax=Wenzhouxiangella sp. AB-CW3 TaxID=2771012 RepID=UPI00168ACCAE|nr:hypothetical protein [Wenzhouxiangella sp. AB-CW3]QOC22266.1 hypothetical protein IC757_14785 [Wenzhouxiangella sp. AB-CW3]